MTRLADVNDIPKILPLLMDYRTFYGVKTQDIDEAERFLHERLSKSESIVFVTFHEGEAVGFIQLYPSFSTVSLKRQWHLNDLFVPDGIQSMSARDAILREIISNSLAH